MAEKFEILPFTSNSEIVLRLKLCFCFNSITDVTTVKSTYYLFYYQPCMQTLAQISRLTAFR